MRQKKFAQFDTRRLDNAPRCTAKSKRSGKRCQAPAVRGRYTCRMHGGPGSGAPSGPANGNYRHGGSTKEAIYLMRDLNMLGRLLKRLPR
jgi:hypothetical protein